MPSHCSQTGSWRRIMQPPRCNRWLGAADASSIWSVRQAGQQWRAPARAGALAASRHSPLAPSAGGSETLPTAFPGALEGYSFRRPCPPGNRSLEPHKAWRPAFSKPASLSAACSTQSWSNCTTCHSKLDWTSSPSGALLQLRSVRCQAATSPLSQRAFVSAAASCSRDGANHEHSSLLSISRWSIGEKSRPARQCAI